MDNKPNVLLITVDDMNWDAIGAFGCPTPATTPNIDRLAAAGMAFHRAHVNIAVCQPSRSAMLTGRYPHRCGGEGFHKLRLPGIPILPDLLRRAGYDTGILGKVDHSTPHADYAWDMAYDMPELGMGRNPDVYYRHAHAFINEAVQNGRPFFLMANSHDPHRPFYGNDRAEWYDGTVEPPAVPPSKQFQPNDVTVPGFLPDLPDVRQEIAEYYSSVRRADDTVGRLLTALDEANVRESTFVMFLSDNGMAFPFAKTNCYLHSTKTPLIVRWPGHVPAGAVDKTHLVSGIDILPTIMEAAGLPAPGNIDGQSFFDVLQGAPSAAKRDKVFTQFHETARRRHYPMRCVQTARYGYIFNAWSNGERPFKNESQSGRTFKAMKQGASNDTKLAARIDHFIYRTQEELYDFARDPDALHNLINDPNLQDVANTMRIELEAWMEQTNDPALHVFRQRSSPQAVKQFMDRKGLSPRIDEKANDLNT